MSGRRTAFDRSIEQALANENIATALGNFSVAYPVSRAKAYEGIDFEELRGQLVERRGHAAAHLEELAETFTRNARARGTVVHRVSSPQQARDVITGICRDHGVRTLVKSKSMATEEIHLNRHLEAVGIRPFETDLGEWIIQLLGQRPSHMVMPAIHLTRDEVAEVFSKEVDERLTSDIPRLVKVARNELRGRFLAADLGLTGANIAVAETGTLMIVTNEGNARLVSTLPPVHVAVVGLEKLVATLDDAVPVLRALPRSATGQLLTSYVSMISGPVENTDGSTKELHVVLMDNHRSDMAADPVFQQALRCIRCASCLNVCPVFRLVGGHVFGDVYTGGIGTILTAWFDELKKSEDIQGLCIQCGKCTEVCPAGIDIAGLILELRKRLAAKDGLPLAQRAIFSVVNNRRLFHGMLRAAYVAQKPFAREGYIRHLPLFLSKLTQDRSLMAIAEHPFRDQFARAEQVVARPQGPGGVERATVYAGCLIDFAYPEIGMAVVRVLNKAGIEVVFDERQTCCGAPARISGATDVAAGNARDNLRALGDPSLTYIVSACPTCTVALRHDFAELLADGAGDGDGDGRDGDGRDAWLERAASVAARTVDFSTLVRRLVREGRLRLRPGQDLGKITYHDSCHYKRTLHAEQNPRDLLRESGFELAEMAESDVCCGMGGSYFAKHPEMSGRMLDRKLGNIRATGAPLVATDCPGCVMHLRGGLDKARDRAADTAGARIGVRHTVEVIEQALL